jgi:hypothetical protein
MGLTATAASTTEIDLAWIDNASNQTGFLLQSSPEGSTQRFSRTVEQPGNRSANAQNPPLFHPT